jgi:hypothetical protein
VASPPAPTPPPRRFPRPSASGIVKGTATLVGLVSGILALVFLVRPELQPQADEPPPPPARTRATLVQTAFSPSITRRAYLARTDQSSEGFTPKQLAARGAFVRFRVRINGFKGVPITLARELIDEEGEEVSDEKAVTITPPAPEVDRDWHDWVALDDRQGRFFLTFKLLAPDEDGALATLETDPFPGLGDERS